ncbi:MAG: hypothetical protein PVI87_09655 [Gammaproteobacteria bacterium]|jgi:hypothetical protein
MRRDIPRSAAWAFSAWMGCWIPVVLWAYGPQNFLWICNIAQFMVLYAVWRGDRLVLSSQAGTVCVVGLVWGLDLLLGLATGGRTASFTAYMFDPQLPLAARIVSLYHVGLPLYVLWLLRRTGYDDRGPRLQVLVGGVAVVAGWLLTEPVRNVNWVHRPFGIEQAWLPEPVFVALLLVLYPALLFWPGHWLVRAALRRLR